MTVSAGWDDRSRLPNLGAQYRGLSKCCQEKFATTPQNLWLFVSKPSMYSGVIAARPYAEIRANSFAGARRVLLVRTKKVNGERCGSNGQSPRIQIKSLHKGLERRKYLLV